MGVSMYNKVVILCIPQDCDLQFSLHHCDKLALSYNGTPKLTAQCDLELSQDITVTRMETHTEDIQGRILTLIKITLFLQSSPTNDKSE